MTFYPQAVENAISVYKNTVRASERRALRLARVEPRAKERGGLVRKAAGWLGKQRVSVSRDRRPEVRIAHGKQVAG